MLGSAINSDTSGDIFTLMLVIRRGELFEWDYIFVECNGYISVTFNQNIIPLASVALVGKEEQRSLDWFTQRFQ